MAMASSPIPFRSISLPSRIHPNPDYNSKLEKLQSFQAPKSTPISSETIQSSLLSLAELFTSIQELTQSPSTQHSVALHGKSSEESLLEGSVELLDSCDTIKELLQMIKDNVQSLQSAFRRKGRDSTIQSDIAIYFTFRKKMNVSISKSLKKLKSLENRINSSKSLVYVDEHLIMALRERTRITIMFFKSILLFFSCPTPKSGGWKFVRKAISTKSDTKCKDQSIMSEVGSVDFALVEKVLNVEMVQERLQNLDSCIGGIEVGLDTLFRQLIQCRVTLLNILNGV